MDREDVRIVDAYKPEDIRDAIVDLVERDRLGLLVVQGLCVILRRRRERSGRSG
jgi:hypothetical protein